MDEVSRETAAPPPRHRRLPLLPEEIIIGGPVVFVPGETAPVEDQPDRLWDVAELAPRLNHQPEKERINDSV